MSVMALAGCAPAYSDYAEVVSKSPAPAAKRQAATGAVPLPSQALLVPQRKPDCEGDKTIADGPASAEQTASSGASAAIVPPQPEANADLALRIKLEYERECYRQAEIRVRERLQKLQASASETTKAVRRMGDEAR